MARGLGLGAVAGKPLLGQEPQALGAAAPASQQDQQQEEDADHGANGGDDGQEQLGIHGFIYRPGPSRGDRSQIHPPSRAFVKQ